MKNCFTSAVITVIKNNLIVLFLFLVVFSNAQNRGKTELHNFFKIEAPFDKISLGYEIALNKEFVLDLTAGLGAANRFRNNMGENDLKFGPLFIAQLKYYFSRNRRERKGHSLLTNAGSFWGFQSKFNLNGNSKESGKVWMNEFHFGQQLPWGRDVFFKYHVGIGRATILDTREHRPYFAIGFGFGYAF